MSYESGKEKPTASNFQPEDGSSRLPTNVANFLPHCMAPHPRRQYCSFSMHVIELSAICAVAYFWKNSCISSLLWSY